jgi:hypothetical protein
MTHDIERLLHIAADETEPSWRSSVDDIVRGGRRSVRYRRLAAAAATALVGIGGMVISWPANVAQDSSAAGRPQQGSFVFDIETGKETAPPPPVSTLSDAEILRRCQRHDAEYLASVKRIHADTFDRTGPLDARWKVALKTGTGDRFNAVLVSRDRSIAAFCNADERSNDDTRYLRRSMEFYWSKVVPKDRGLAVVEAADRRIPAKATRVLVEVPGERVVRQALLGRDGFYSLGATTDGNREHVKVRVRGYATNGEKVADQETTLDYLPSVPGR